MLTSRIMPNGALKKNTFNVNGHTHHVLGIAWHCTGRSLATSGADNVIKIWNVTTGEHNTLLGYKAGY